MDGIGNALAGLFYGIIIVSIIVGALVTGGIWFFSSSSEIKSKTLIKPKIVIETNIITVNGITTTVSDTTYIYKK